MYILNIGDLEASPQENYDLKIAVYIKSILACLFTISPTGIIDCSIRVFDCS